MNNAPEIIVGLWLLPVTLIILLSFSLLVWIIIQLPLQFAVRRRVSDQEKRAHRRIHADDLRVDVSDGIDLFSGLVCNVSRMGICIMGLPEKVFQQVERLAVVVDYHGDSYSLHVTPRWERIRKSGKQIGAEIEYAPDSWLDLVKKSSSFAVV